RKQKQAPPPDLGDASGETIAPSVSRSLATRIHAFLSSDPRRKDKSEIIIDSGATRHMVPHWSWLTSYRKLDPPIPVAFGDNSTAKAIGIGRMVLKSVISRRTFEFELANVLLIPEFHITLISINCLQSAGLTTSFPGNTHSCIVQRGSQTVMTGA